jgi:hypothetical protein
MHRYNITVIKGYQGDMKVKKPLRTDSVLNFAGISLEVGFIIRMMADYYKYQTGIDSTPLNVLLFERSLEFLLPSIVCFIAAKYLKRRNQLR